MNSDPTAKNSDVYIPVFSFNENTGEAFFEDLGFSPGVSADFLIGGRTAQLELVRVLQVNAINVEYIAQKADAIIMLVKYLDRLSLERIKHVYKQIEKVKLTPKTIAIIKEPGESHYILSCTHCTKPISVKDRNVGKRGNCPHCRKVIRMPAQDTFLISHLMLTDMINLQTLTLGKNTSTNIIDTLSSQLDHPGESSVTTAGTGSAKGSAGLLRRLSNKVLRRNS